MKNKTAFTLAETLIVIAIIGVISVLTLPNVMGNYKKKTYVAQLQKAYNQISQAAQQLMVDEDADSLADTSLAQTGGATKFLKKYFKTVKICTPSASSGEYSSGSSTNSCLASQYKFMDGSVDDYEYKFLNNNTDAACAVLNTGATICISKWGKLPDIAWDDSDYTGWADVLIDVNGLNGPNTFGRDVFGGLSLWNDNSLTAPVVSCDNTDDGYAAGTCFAKIIQDGWKMDY